MSVIDRFKNPQQEKVRRMLEKLAKDKSMSIGDIKKSKEFRKFFPDEKTATSALAFMTVGKLDAAIQMATYRSAKKDKHVVRVSQETLSKVSQRQLSSLALKKTPEDMARTSSGGEGDALYSLNSFIPLVQVKGGEVSQQSIQNYLMETFVGTARLFDDSGKLVEGTNIDKDRFRILLERNYAKDMVMPIDGISRTADSLSQVIYSQFSTQTQLDEMLAEFNNETSEERKAELSQNIADARTRIMGSNAFIVDHITTLQAASKTNQIVASNISKTVKVLDAVEKNFTPEAIESSKADLIQKRDDLESRETLTDAEREELAKTNRELLAIEKGYPNYEVENRINNFNIDSDAQLVAISQEAISSYAGAINNYRQAFGMVAVDSAEMAASILHKGELSILPPDKIVRVNELLKNPSVFGIQGRQGQAYLNKQSVLINFIESYQIGCTGEPEDDMIIGMLRCANDLVKANQKINEIENRRVSSLLDLNDMKILAGYSAEECVAKFDEILPERAKDVKTFLMQQEARTKASLEIDNKAESIEFSVDNYNSENFKFNGKTLVSEEEYNDIKRATEIMKDGKVDMLTSQEAFKEALKDKLVDEMKVELSHAEFSLKDDGTWQFVDSTTLEPSQLMADLGLSADVINEISNNALQSYKSSVENARLTQTFKQYNQLLNDGNLNEARKMFEGLLEEVVKNPNLPIKEVVLSDPMAQGILSEKIKEAEKEEKEVEKAKEEIELDKKTLSELLDGKADIDRRSVGAAVIRLTKEDGQVLGPEIENLKIFLATQGTANAAKAEAISKGLTIANLTHGKRFNLPENVELTPDKKNAILEALNNGDARLNKNELDQIVKALESNQLFFPGSNSANPEDRKENERKNRYKKIIADEFGIDVKDLQEQVGYFPIGKDAEFLKELAEKTKEIPSVTKNAEGLKDLLKETSKPSWQRQKYIGKDTRIQPGKEAENEKKKKEAEKQLQEEFDKPSVGPGGQVNMGKLIYMLGNVDNVIDAAKFSAQHFQKSNALLAQHKTVQLSYPGLGMCEGGIHRDTTNSLYSKYQMTSDVQAFLKTSSGQLRFSEASIDLAIGRIETYINKGALTPDALMHLMTTNKYLNVMGLNKDPDVYKRFMQELEDRGMIPPKTLTGNDINFDGKSEIERFEYSYNLKKNSKKYNFTLTKEQIAAMTPAQQKQYAKDKDEFDKNFIQARVFSTDGAKIKPSEVAKLFEKGGPLADVSPAVRIWYNEKLKEAISTDQLGYYSINDNKYVAPDERTGGEVLVEVKYGPPEKLQLNSIDDLRTYLNKTSAINNGCLPADVLDKIPFDLIEIPGMTFEEKARFEKEVEAAALTRIAQAKESEATYGLVKNANGEMVPYTIEDEIRDRSKFVFDGPDTLSKEERDWLIANQEHIDAIRTQKIELVKYNQAKALGDEHAGEKYGKPHDMVEKLGDCFMDNYSYELVVLKSIENGKPDGERLSEEMLEAKAREKALSSVQEVYGNECLEGAITNKSAFNKAFEIECAKKLYLSKRPEVVKFDSLDEVCTLTKSDGTVESISINEIGKALGEADLKLEVGLNQPLLEAGKKPEDNCLYTFDIQNGVKNATPLEQAVAKAEAPLIQSIQKAKTSYYQGSTERVIDGKTTENANGDVAIFCNNIMKDVKQEIKNISQIKDPKQREARMRALEQVLYREGLIGFMQNNPNGKAMVEQLKAELAQETQKEHDGVDLDKAPEIEEVANEQDAVEIVDEIVQADPEKVENDLALQLEDLAASGVITMMNDKPSVDPNAIEEMGM